MKSITAVQFYSDMMKKTGATKKECGEALKLLEEQGNIKIQEYDLHGNPSSFKLTDKGKGVTK